MRGRYIMIIDSNYLLSIYVAHGLLCQIHNLLMESFFFIFSSAARVTINVLENLRLEEQEWPKMIVMAEF
jgi:hypothetical protein